MLKITFTPESYADYLNWLETDKKTFIKLNNLIRETAVDPTRGIGKPESLKHDLTGFWSRRINSEHRLVYSFNNIAIEIISCRFHYK